MNDAHDNLQKTIRDLQGHKAEEDDLQSELQAQLEQSHQEEKDLSAQLQGAQEKLEAEQAKHIELGHSISIQRSATRLKKNSVKESKKRIQSVRAQDTKDKEATSAKRRKVEERIISLNRAVLRQLNPEFGQPQASGSSNGDDFGGDDDDEVCAIKALKAQLLTIRSKTSEPPSLPSPATAAAREELRALREREQALWAHIGSVREQLQNVALQTQEQTAKKNTLLNTGRELHQQLDAAEAAEEQTRARWEEFPEHLRQDQVARSLSEDQGGGAAASDDAAAAAATTAH